MNAMFGFFAILKMKNILMPVLFLKIDKRRKYVIVNKKPVNDINQKQCD